MHRKMKLGDDPWKLYGVTHDGNGNELKIFISAFKTKEEVEQYPINKDEFFDRWIGIEEDF